MPSLFQSTRNTRWLPTGDLRFIRSDCPEKLTGQEVAWLLQNHVTTIVDLREKREYERTPCCLEEEDGFTVYHLPVTGGGEPPRSPGEVAPAYLAMLDKQMDKIIETIMGAKSNVLYFCAAGKDRTGVVSAVILKKLGVDDQTIVDDYMQTRENLFDFLANYARDHPQVDSRTVFPHENTIRRVLEELSVLPEA